MTVSPTPVVGGGPATGRLQFDQNPDGISVTLTSSHPDIVTVAGATGLTTHALRPGFASDLFPISTEVVTEPVDVTITASYWSGATETTTFTVVPGTPPPPDTVEIRDGEAAAGHRRTGHVRGAQPPRRRGYRDPRRRGRGRMPG